jgi:hypothetical protein
LIFSKKIGFILETVFSYTPLVKYLALLVNTRHGLKRILIRTNALAYLSATEVKSFVGFLPRMKIFEAKQLLSRKETNSSLAYYQLGPSL